MQLSKVKLGEYVTLGQHKSAEIPWEGVYTHTSLHQQDLLDNTTY